MKKLNDIRFPLDEGETYKSEGTFKSALGALLVAASPFIAFFGARTMIRNTRVGYKTPNKDNADEAGAEEA